MCRRGPFRLSDRDRGIVCSVCAVFIVTVVGEALSGWSNEPPGTGLAQLTRSAVSGLTLGAGAWRSRERPAIAACVSHASRIFIRRRGGCQRFLAANRWIGIGAPSRRSCVARSWRRTSDTRA